MKQKYGILFSAAIAGLSLNSVLAAPHILTTGAGDGTVTVGVDGFGAFGSANGPGGSDAIFDPVGPVGAAGTTFHSMVAFGTGAGSRTFLSAANLGSNPTISGDANSASSSFAFGGLVFQLSQSINNTANGVLLTQSYSIFNPSEAAQSFELIRYLDGDLSFDGSISDGGGRIVSGGTEILFETDTATGSSTEATFVGITGLGGTIPLSGRFQISSYSGLLSLIASGGTLNDGITGDSADADQFIDAGNGYDVTLALRNIFEIGAFGTANYTTHTIFGVEAPDDVEEPNPVPEPATVLGGAALAALAAVRGIRRKK